MAFEIGSSISRTEFHIDPSTPHAMRQISVIDDALVPVTDVSIYEMLNAMKDLIMFRMSEMRRRANDRRNR